jgi:hypothetical protein
LFESFYNRFDGCLTQDNNILDDVENRHSLPKISNIKQGYNLERLAAAYSRESFIMASPSLFAAGESPSGWAESRGMRLKMTTMKV